MKIIFKLSMLMIMFCGMSIKAQNLGKEQTKNADKDWQVLNSLNMFPAEDDYQSYLKLQNLELKKFEDDFYLKVMNLSKLFYENYPGDARRDTARGMFISADPLFIDKVSLQKRQGLDSIPRKEWLRFMRALPIDVASLNDWIHTGNSMVSEVLESETSLETKEAAEFSLFARDFRMASKYFSLLPKQNSEDDYWEFVCQAYWNQFFMRFDKHVNTYATLEILGSRAKDFLSNLKGRAPKITENYWRQLLSSTAETEMQGLRTLHQVAKEQLEALVVERGSLPIDMSFVSMQDTKVDVKQMRGKVILIDFWATWCKPCLSEIPHLKEMYTKYHSQGFEIIGISLDEKDAEAKVKKIIKENGMPWPQRFTGNGFGSDPYKLLYGINSLPTVWLLDKEGKVVDTNARGEKLEPLIRKYLGL